MSAVKPIIRELKQAALKGFAHADHKLHQLTDNIGNHLDDIVLRVRGKDKFDGRNASWSLRGGWDRNASTKPNDFADGGRYDYANKKSRPDPDTYLSDEYIRKHLARFDNGGSRIYVSQSLTDWGPGQGDHTVFVFPKDELADVLKKAGNDTDKLEDLLGLDRGSFRDPDTGMPLDVEIRHFTREELGDLSMPSGREDGANPNWLPGGELPTGIHEAVGTMPDTATGDRNGGGGPSTWPGTPGGSYPLR